MTISGVVVYEKSGVQLTSLPAQGLEVNVATVYGSEPLISYAEVSSDGSWETGIILPSRSLLDGILTISYSITGVPSPGIDISDIETLVTVDELDPVVQFSSVPLSLDNEELEVLQFAILIIDEGGMPEGDLQVNWAFMRNGLVLENGQSSDMIPFISSNAEAWSYVGSIDFTEGVNVSLESGDELVWWMEVTDRSGNSATGTGLSMIDAMNTDFTVLSFDITVTNLEIALSDGSAPRGNEIVEGTEISTVVQLRNLGTKPGTVTITLMEDLGESRSWLSHGSVQLTLSPGQTLKAAPLLFETHGAGSQNLHVNVTGMDVWIENTIFPHCITLINTTSCDLNVETDMPRVISQDDVGSSFGGMTGVISILVILLAAAGFAIAVLLRRDNSEESMYYDDDDEDDWNDEQYESSEEKVAPIIPSSSPETPDVVAASKALSSGFTETTEQSDYSPSLDEEDSTQEEDVAPVELSELEKAIDESVEEDVDNEPVVEETVVEEVAESKAESEMPKKGRTPVRRKSKSR